MLDFFPCADDHRAKEQIVLRDTDGGRLVSFIISGGQLSVHGRKSVPKPSPEILSWGNTSVNLLDPVPFLGEHAARATPPAEGSEETTTKAAAPLTLRPKAWHRLECSFQWVTHTCVVRLSLLRQDGKAHGTQHVHKIIMESDSTGMHSVDIFPRADLVLCYCNMCLLYT
ncbi:hypothetical protein AGDE_15730 [Angomonas deanei]|uniref:Uncharacterized protein n=1 Tax=Angomonas deanei TaxID=59799 RepID=A0A7G2CQQ9_9TRYP|nr:hypothetical protein AGDE_15730 [Angomonas deanei]CAD2222166.1 hypothetical protein, conserved [Angomonas deanei]|eukprot:EPY18563.1 hypothetical protein AGDE_15730 [Angomonas deanei]